MIRSVYQLLFVRAFVLVIIVEFLNRERSFDLFVETGGVRGNIFRLVFCFIRIFEKNERKK